RLACMSLEHAGRSRSQLEAKGGARKAVELEGHRNIMGMLNTTQHLAWTAEAQTAL
ncbi:hypothetical protein NDU88_005886, partial [Pleurodeles waltl]